MQRRNLTPGRIATGVSKKGMPTWAFKVILTFRDFTVLGDRAHAEAIEKRLYPKWEAHGKAERRHWEIMEKHWDDIMVEVGE